VSLLDEIEMNQKPDITNIRINFVLTVVLVLSLCMATHILMAGEPITEENPLTQKLMARIMCDDVRVALAPYVWKRTGTGETARAEATMPGAYLKLDFMRSSTLGLLVDGTANSNCVVSCMPAVDYSVDDGPFNTIQLSLTGRVYVLPLARELDVSKQHHAEFFFRAGYLVPDRWTEATHHLRIAGVELDAGGTLMPPSIRAKRAIAFGDSITEGVNVDGTVPYYSNLFMNNARGTWFPIVCAALGCEYGQLGTGGQGMVRTNVQIPPLPQTWDHYDAATSRLTNGLLQPEPDYVFCEMGTNDFEERDKKRRHMDITIDYINWLIAVRKSCPNANIFCITPPLGWHASEVEAAVKVRTAAGDRNVHLIDTAPLIAGFKTDEGATTLAGDGVHPSQYGNAMLGALIAVETQKVLNGSHLSF
jgi:lysophospholipase L1-like esterase